MIDDPKVIEEMLAKETQDGPGDLDALPEEDFESFATDDAEIEVDDE